MFSNVVLLYLDRQREALIGITVFLVANGIGTMLTVRWGYQFFGLGYASACLVGLIVTLYLLCDQLYNLEFMTFVTPEVNGQRSPRRGLRARNSGGYGRYNPVARPKGASK